MIHCGTRIALRVGCILIIVLLCWAAPVSAGSEEPVPISELEVLAVVASLFDPVPLLRNDPLSQRIYGCASEVFEMDDPYLVNIKWAATSPVVPDRVLVQLTATEVLTQYQMRYLALRRIGDLECFDFGADPVSLLCADSGTSCQTGEKAMLQAALTSVICDREEQFLWGALIGAVDALPSAVSDMEQFFLAPSWAQDSVMRQLGMNQGIWYSGNRQPHLGDGGSTTITWQRSDSVSCVSFELLYYAFKRPRFTYARFNVSFRGGHIAGVRKNTLKTAQELEELREWTKGPANR